MPAQEIIDTLLMLLTVSVQTLARSLRFLGCDGMYVQKGAGASLHALWPCFVAPLAGVARCLNIHLAKCCADQERMDNWSFLLSKEEATPGMNVASMS